MKAMVCTKYGSPDVFQLQEVDTPLPKDHEVRIKIQAASVGPADCTFRKGSPLVQLVYGLKRPRNSIFGAELSGEIDLVGEKVTRYKVGDQVLGLSAKTFGAQAEYKCLHENTPLAIKSSAMSFEEAVAVCDGAPTALTFLRDKAQLQHGQTVLINGASGAVGIYAVQIAKYLGAKVTGVCSTANVELVKSHGADKVIDYTREDFTTNGQTYDVIFDAVGKRSFAQCKGSLSQRGVYLSTSLSFSILFDMLRTAALGKKKAIFVTAGLMQNQANLIFLKELFEAGKIKAVIDRRYPLEQVAEAHRYVEKGHKKGNVIITLK
ncbi:NAD(P)-dependent alcohol dehydrogenase [Bacillus salipaludis]|uniref:NAD(P)-dependent alcohol dehydrogenase n=2 Tax=Bacillus salipaludis TaxID=2547811 RepID=A0A4R5VWZ5_9BACI|nr:NAD(P)-dependent alcohol dehydrogenase [Bacillus salipaludis]MDQ6597702.1 NAD(P)-dependent alcohol dehydrogenase [Bacillus salipaludis]TDK63410.1 NAD(P)-dependent alcohol dehydrogenase [Bacillus salipaludis]